MYNPLYQQAKEKNYMIRLIDIKRAFEKNPTFNHDKNLSANKEKSLVSSAWCRTPKGTYSLNKPKISIPGVPRQWLRVEQSGKVRADRQRYQEGDYRGKG